MILLLLAVVAGAQVAPECDDASAPSDYDEQLQGDYLQNHPSLALTFSPIHAPIPHTGGHGALGVDIAVIPPVSCEKRFVLNETATREVNFTPVAPKLHASFSFPSIGRTTMYAGLAYLPPIQIFGQRTVLASAELGVGGAWFENVPYLQLGARGHATWSKTVADIATARVDGDPDLDDLYVQSSFGVDALIGWAFSWATPYVAVGFTDLWTYFYVGDDGTVINNLHPYSSFTFSVGLDGLVADHFRWGVEFYGAPGGYSKPDKEVESSAPAPAYGHLYTGRVRLAYEF